MFPPNTTYEISSESVIYNERDKSLYIHTNDNHGGSLLIINTDTFEHKKYDLSKWTYLNAVGVTVR